MEELVTKVLQAGVNYVHGIDFQTTEFKKYREQARNLALRAAKEKAEMMAGVLGQSAGAPIQINEDFSARLVVLLELVRVGIWPQSRHVAECGPELSRRIR